MIKVIKGLGVVVGLICSLLVFIVVCLVAINATDRTKSPNTLLVETWLKQQSIDPAQNGFVYLQAFSGTIEDVTAKEMATTLSFNDEENQLLSDYKKSCYQTDVASCNEFIEKNNDSILQTIKAHKANITHYNKLIEMPYWQEDIQYLTPESLFKWLPLLNLRAISELSVLINFDGATKLNANEALLTFLTADAQFWNMVYHSSRSIVNHMIAVSVIKSQLNFASTVAKTLDSAFVNKVTTWQTPFELTNNDFERVFSGEWQFAHNVREQMLIEVQSDEVAFYEKWLADALYKPTDSDNLMAEYIVSLVKEPVSTSSAHTVIKPDYCSLDNYIKQLWMSRYNPIGKLFNCTVYETDYKQRLTNINTELEQLRANLLTETSS
ncbi:hypothetical protein [Shewanella sp. SR43-8]|uniref:hypothetical protein n=1 Tax=Shewanella sp. SR43-8 TaxID=2760938 RepID=UPI0015FECB9A|nr:hypothetical protein [Shewanella sp. SR43-8]MBB1320303.1 hypothetical protein [Shewanella sp. SR43-8]